MLLIWYYDTLTFSLIGIIQKCKILAHHSSWWLEVSRKVEKSRLRGSRQPIDSLILWKHTIKFKRRGKTGREEKRKRSKDKQKGANKKENIKNDLPFNWLRPICPSKSGSYKHADCWIMKNNWQLRLQNLLMIKKGGQRRTPHEKLILATIFLTAKAAFLYTEKARMWFTTKAGFPETCLDPMQKQKLHQSYNFSTTNVKFSTIRYKSIAILTCWMY